MSTTRAPTTGPPSVRRSQRSSPRPAVPQTSSRPRGIWFFIVFPALTVNYLAQGALILRDPGRTNPFYLLLPGWAQLPLVALATTATVIASQASARVQP
jgi:hypothetical protein